MFKYTLLKLIGAHPTLLQTELDTNITTMYAVQPVVVVVGFAAIEIWNAPYFTLVSLNFPDKPGLNFLRPAAAFFCHPYHQNLLSISHCWPQQLT